jgi:MYXO-CTERM domain-containing protein
MRKTLTTMIAAFAMLGAPGLALAGDNAAVEEYVLDIPGAGGTEHGDDAAGGGNSGSTPSPGAGAASEAQADDGAATAEPAQATGADRNAGDDQGGGTGPAAVGTTADADADDSGIFEALADLLSGSDSGMGPALPILLALTLLGAVVLAVRRRRRETPTES